MWGTNEIKAHWKSEVPPRGWISSERSTFAEIEKRIDRDFLERIHHAPETAVLLKEVQLERLKAMKVRFGEGTEIRLFGGSGKYRGIEGYVFYIDSKPIDTFIPNGFVFTHMPDGTLRIKG